MLKELTDRGKALAFYTITLALILAVALMPGASTEVGMLTPLVAVVIMLFIVTRDGYTKDGLKSLGLHRLAFHAWPVAIGGPLLVLGVAYTLLWSTGVADFTVPAPFTEESARLSIPVWLLVPFSIVVTIFTIGLVSSLGEEIGWRGYLLPRLEFLGVWAAVLLTGLAHAVFHLPFIVLTTLYHPGGNRLIVLPLFLVSVTMVGMFLGYLRLSTGSVWPAVLAHSSHNSVWGVFSVFAAESSPLASEYLAGESGVLVIFGYATLGGWLMYTLTKKGSPGGLPTSPEAATEST
jgi:membrane protease YdiL (CAAX protease family)